ncbi:unnamed protein product [Amoebophrya sp. A120]|nr:unnamed protein product [Amoebophrya sp. A120]|eukprot:GSA120T00020406001.1
MTMSPTTRQTAGEHKQNSACGEDLQAKTGGIMSKSRASQENCSSSWCTSTPSDETTSTPPPKPTTTGIDCVISLVATAVGGGILAVPFTMYVAGFFGGCFLCLVVTIFSNWSLLILCEAASVMERNAARTFSNASGNEKKQYEKLPVPPSSDHIGSSSSSPPPPASSLPAAPSIEQLCVHFFPSTQGRLLSLIVKTALVWLLLCAASALLIIYASNICQLFGFGEDFQGWLILLSLVCVFPATCQSRLDALKVFSGVANLGTGCVFLFFVIRLLTGSVAKDVSLLPIQPTLGAFFQALPPVLTAFCCHFNVLQIRSELVTAKGGTTGTSRGNRSLSCGASSASSAAASWTMANVVNYSMLTVGTLHALFGVLGYAICGQNGMETDILLSQQLFHFKGSGAASIGVGFNAYSATAFQQNTATLDSRSVEKNADHPDLAVQWGIASYLQYGISISIFCVAVSNLLRYPLLVLPLRDVLESLFFRKSDLSTPETGDATSGPSPSASLLQQDGAVQAKPKQQTSYLSFTSPGPDTAIIDFENRGQEASTSRARTLQVPLLLSPDETRSKEDGDISKSNRVNDGNLANTDTMKASESTSWTTTSGALAGRVKTVNTAAAPASGSPPRFFQMLFVNTVVGLAAWRMRDFSVPLSILGFTAVPLVCFLVPGLIGMKLTCENCGNDYEIRGAILVAFGLVSGIGIFLTTQGVFTPVVQAGK